MPTLLEAKKTLRTPKSLWEISKLMMRLARVAFAEIKTQHSYSIKLSKLEQERDQHLETLANKRNILVSEIFAFAKERKNQITKDGKSITIATGQVGWRLATPSVQIVEGSSEKTIVANLLKRKRRYLRFIPKLNKEEILQDVHDGTFKPIQGVHIRQGEEGFISLNPRGKMKPKIITVDMVLLKK
jgi:phage host-nuclease inhibitor protein Gam